MTSGLLLRCIWWSVCTVKPHSILHLFTSGLCLYHFSFTSFPYFVLIFQWIFVLNQSFHLFYSFWDNLLHSLNTWFTLSSAFPHILYLFLSWVLSIFAFMLLVFIACPCAAIIKASFVLFNHPFLSYLHRSSLALPIVRLINRLCNCFCVHCVFFSFFFLFLYSFGVSLSSFSSIIHAAINNLLSLFLTLFLNLKISVSTVSCTPINPLPPSLFDRCSPSTLLLGWNLLCIVGNFLVLLSISSSQSLDHPRNAAEYLTTDTSQVLIALKTLPLFKFDSNTFLTFLTFL